MGIYRRNIIRKKERKQDLDKEKKKENKILTKKKERNQDLDQEKKANFKIILFSFIDSHLCAVQNSTVYWVVRILRHSVGTNITYTYINK